MCNQFLCFVSMCWLLQMPRKYVHDLRRKVYRKQDKGTIERALRDIENGMSYRTAAKVHGINYSVLYRHKKKIQN